MWIVKATLQDDAGVIYDESFVSDTNDAVANVKRIEDYVAPDRLIGFEVEIASDITEGEESCAACKQPFTFTDGVIE